MKIRNPTTRSQESDVNLAKFRKEAGDNFLSLGINVSSRNCNKNKKSAIINFLGVGSSKNEINHGRALNPTPLSSYHPTQGYKVYSSSSSYEHGASSSSCFAMVEQKDDFSDVNKKKKKKVGPRRRRSRVDDELSLPPEPNNPPQELLQMIGPGVRPVFLYRKQLSEWDTQKHQNRLFVNDRKRMMEFMTEEERLAVEDPKGPGFDVVGIDTRGEEYELRTKKWESLDKLVVKKGWHTILAANGAQKGDWVHLWAFRRDDARFCLFVDFVTSPDQEIDRSSVY